jgi:ABC-2 type transport system permease protein
MSGRTGSLPELRSPNPVTTLAREFRGSYAFIERNLFLVKRYWGWEFAFLIYAVASALSVTFIGAEQGNQQLILTLMIGAIFWNYLSIVFGFIAETVAWERWEGTLEYTFMAPIRRWVQLLGSTMFAVIYGLVHTTVMLVVLTLFFGLDLSGANFATAAVMMILGSASFIGIGMMAAVLPLMYVERGAQMTFVLQSLLLLVSGVYYSVEVLPEWMQVLSRFSPATYVLDGVRAGLIQGTPIDQLWHDIWPLAIMAVVFIPLGIWIFGRAERYAKRTGKLKRVG